MAQLKTSLVFLAVSLCAVLACKGPKVDTGEPGPMRSARAAGAAGSVTGTESRMAGAGSNPAPATAGSSGWSLVRDVDPTALF